MKSYQLVSRLVVGLVVVVVAIVDQGVFVVFNIHGLEELRFVVIEDLGQHGRFLVDQMIVVFVEIVEHRMKS